MPKAQITPVMVLFSGNLVTSTHVILATFLSPFAATSKGTSAINNMLIETPLVTSFAMSEFLSSTKLNQKFRDVVFIYQKPVALGSN